MNQRSEVTLKSLPLAEAVNQPRILIVEDDPALAQLEAGILNAQGFVVMIASSGEHALQALRQSPPDLVVLDLELEDALNGWDVFIALRRYTTAPVLLTSSSESDVSRFRSSSQENRSTLDYLPKPYALHVFLKRIKRMLVIAS